MNNYIVIKENKLIKNVFIVSTFIKFIVAILELIGGFFLLFVNGLKFSRWVINTGNSLLLSNPNDIFGTYALKLITYFSAKAQYFFSAYLLIHGFIKIGMLYGIWKNKLWVYPISIFIFVILLGYQIYQYSVNNYFLLLILCVFDAFYIALVLYEYLTIKNKSQT